MLVLAPPPQEIMLKSSTVAKVASSTCRIRLFVPQNSPANTVAKKNGKPFSGAGVKRACVEVATVTVTGIETLLAVNVADAGLAVHVVPAGAPLQATETVPVKPLPCVFRDRL